MWPRTFEQRLKSWYTLRQNCQSLDLAHCLHAVNSWWFKTPWTAYHLHWDDRTTWPDPWLLLNDNVFCSIARGLGILYTIAMLERPDVDDAVLIETDSDNLVLVNKKKYILNWDPDLIVNINPGRTNSRHQLTLQQIKTRIL